MWYSCWSIAINWLCETSFLSSNSHYLPIISIYIRIYVFAQVGFNISAELSSGSLIKFFCCKIFYIFFFSKLSLWGACWFSVCLICLERSLLISLSKFHFLFHSFQIINNCFFFFLVLLLTALILKNKEFFGLI